MNVNAKILQRAKARLLADGHDVNGKRNALPASDGSHEHKRVSGLFRADASSVSILTNVPELPQLEQDLVPCEWFR